MSPPRRRSSRLRGSSVTPGKSLNNASNRLESLTERDETPTSGAQPSLNAIVSSPLAPRTPTTTGRIKAAFAEMHPSKAQQSTTQEPDSGLRLGFTDIDTSGRNQPSGVAQQTPTKSGISSPSFDFRFARPAPQLGPEAQRMMDELREEALRIKVKLAAEREEEKRRARESGVGIEGRKFAQPKGKVGRFSDVHMAEFKKMDSIAGHPSAFRAQPSGFAPVTNNLKRTQSKAQLGDRDDVPKKVEQVTTISGQTERLENTSPAKRARKHVSEDTSSARPVSRGDSKPSTPTIPRSQSTMLATVNTPTQASLARAANAKQTQIPTLHKSPSKPNLLGTPRGLTKSATTNNLSSIPKPGPQSILRSPGKLDRVKSMLRYPSFGTKKPAAVPSSIPSLTRSPSKPNLDKALPSAPGTPVAAKVVKHVNFTPDTVNKNTATIQNSPSPMKSGIPRSASKISFAPKPLAKQGTDAKADPMVVEYPSLAGVSKIEGSKKVEYPSLSGVRPLPEPPRQKTAASVPPPPAPGTFTFRSDHTIKFGSSPRGFGSSPGQSSVRQVRQSIFPGSMPGAFPSGNKENSAPLPAIPHGMSNKKRRRADSDDEAEEDREPSPKKQKAAVAEGPMLMAPKLQATPQSRMSSPTKKKGVLSLSRLNMLARPKLRK